jgi:rare lipoprotein A
VTNLENGLQVEVCVVDRGPYVKGRVIDLSSEAAKAIGLKAKGTARVRVEDLGVEDVD